MPSARTAALTLSIAVAGVLGLTAPPAQAAPTPHTRCRGEGTDPAAHIRYASDIVIDAPLSTIWKLQTDVERWPTWQPPVLTAERLDPGPLRKGSAFRWTTPAPATPSTPATTLDVTSTVRQLDKRRPCIL